MESDMSAITKEPGQATFYRVLLGVLVLEIAGLALLRVPITAPPPPPAPAFRVALAPPPAPSAAKTPGSKNKSEAQGG